MKIDLKGTRRGPEGTRIASAWIFVVLLGLLPGAAWAVDTDGDAVDDTVDNCPQVFNPSQDDFDQNGIGDLCQCGDVNGDGVTNVTDALQIARGEVLSNDPNFPKCDVNGDGVCNVTDALGIARGEVGSAPGDQLCPAYVAPPPPSVVVSFGSIATTTTVTEVGAGGPGPVDYTLEEVGATVDEGVGTFNVPLSLDRPFVGTLQYTIEGTASAADHGPLTGSVAVNGDTASIPVPIVDDDEIEPIEWITLVLTVSPDLQVGAAERFQLRITDNDGSWRGTVSAPGVASLGFQLRIIRATAFGVDIELVGDGLGLIPPGSFFSFFPTLTSTRFQAGWQGMTIDGARAGFQDDLRLNLSLVALEGEPGHSITDDSIEGDATLDIDHWAQPELNRRLEGEFSLVRQATPPNPTEVELVDVAAP